MVNLTIADGRATKAYALWNFEENSSYECHLSLPLQQPPLPFKGLLLHVRLSGAGPAPDRLLAGAERVDQSKSPEWPLKTVTFFYLPSPKLLRDVFMVLFDRKKSQKYLTVIFTDNGRKSCFAKGRTLLFIRPFIFQTQWLFPRLTVLQ